MKYTLILNSNKNNWPNNSNLYFLGYWCLENKKNSFKNISKYKIIHQIKKNKNVDQDVKKIIKIYSSLQKDIKLFLNNYHNVNYSNRFWDIVIGPWLKSFIGIVYERYTSLENVLKDKKINEILLIESNLKDLSTHNVSDLEYKASKNLNEWNTVLYTHIFEYLNLPHKKKFFKNIEHKIQIQKKNINYFFMQLLSLLNYFIRKKNILFMAQILNLNTIFFLIII